MKTISKIMPIALGLALTACGGSGSGDSAAGQLKIVGSSTVYPFTTAVAEQFQKDNPGVSVVVESTGTGGGMKLFCAGVGEAHPDIVNASRAMKASEYEMCKENGVVNVIEQPVGIDGLTLIQSKGGQEINVTPEDIYAALAANPYGKPQTAKTWKDVNPSLPDLKIRVLGPPPTSGTRDSFNDLVIEVGCKSNADMKALKDSDEDAYKQTCTGLRTDGAFVEVGENDNLLVQKIVAEPGSIGVLGYSFLEENADKVQAVKINGVLPTEETIQNLTYPGSRTLYIYLKGEHMNAKPAMKDFVAAYAEAMGAGGTLSQRGLVPFNAEEGEAAKMQASELKPLDPSTLK